MYESNSTHPPNLLPKPVQADDSPVMIVLGQGEILYAHSGTDALRHLSIVNRLQNDAGDEKEALPCVESYSATTYSGLILEENEPKLGALLR